MLWWWDGLLVVGLLLHQGVELVNFSFHLSNFSSLFFRLFVLLINLVLQARCIFLDCSNGPAVICNGLVDARDLCLLFRPQLLLLGRL